MKLDEIQPDMKYLVMGQSGTGKTHLVGTLAELMPTVVVTADKEGLETIKRMKPKPETEIILIELWENIWPYYKQIAELSKTHLAIALDDFGSLQEMSRRRIEKERRTEKEYRMSPAEAEALIRQELMLGDRRMQIQQWGSLWLAMENFLYEVLKLPYKVKLITILEDKAVNPRTGDECIYPALQGGLRTSILARFGLVAETFIAYDKDKPVYCAHCHSHPRIETKTRFGSGRTWVNPSIQKFINHAGGKDDVETELEKRIGVGV
jgi:energy-coupling factor transporter ATP-binding protein EcfA2